MDKELKELETILGPRQGFRFKKTEAICAQCNKPTIEILNKITGAFCSLECLNNYRTLQNFKNPVFKIIKDFSAYVEGYYDE